MPTPDAPTPEPSAAEDRLRVLLWRCAGEDEYGRHWWPCLTLTYDHPHNGFWVLLDDEGTYCGERERIEPADMELLLSCVPTEAPDV